MKSKRGHIQFFCYSKTLNAPFHLQKQKNNCNWGQLQRRVLRHRSDFGLCETPIGTSPATTVRRFCWVGFVSLTRSSVEAPCHTYSYIYMTIKICIYIYIHIVKYIFWNNLPTKPAKRFGSCVSSAEPDSSCSVLDDSVPSAVVSFTCTIQSNLYKLSKHKCSKHHHLVILAANSKSHKEFQQCSKFTTHLAHSASFCQCISILHNTKPLYKKKHQGVVPWTFWATKKSLSLSIIPGVS